MLETNVPALPCSVVMVRWWRGSIWYILRKISVSPSCELLWRKIKYWLTGIPLYSLQRDFSDISYPFPHSSLTGTSRLVNWGSERLCDLSKVTQLERPSQGLNQIHRLEAGRSMGEPLGNSKLGHSSLGLSLTLCSLRGWPVWPLWAWWWTWHPHSWSSNPDSG